MEVTNDASSTQPVVQIQKQGEKDKVEIPLSEFLKVVLTGLPITDSVNDEMRLNNGDVYIPSSLSITAPVVVVKAGEETAGTEGTSTASSTQE